LPDIYFHIFKVKIENLLLYYNWNKINQCYNLFFWNVLTKQTENTWFFRWYSLLLLSDGEKQQNFASRAAKNNEIWSKTKSMNKFNKELHSQNRNIENKNEEITIKTRLKHWNSFFAI
jgi:hypothetical protein